MRNGSRSLKKLCEEWLESDAWLEKLPEIAKKGAAAVGPLLALLPRHPVLKHRAAKALGQLVCEISSKDLESAKNICRRFMWHMNEDSGNIGWGIPEAFAETLAACPALSKIYSSILFSYIMDLGHADNFCDHDALRRSCYWAAGRLLQALPEKGEKMEPWLIKGLSDRDAPCRGAAAWALAQIKPSLMAWPPLKKLKDEPTECEIFESNELHIRKTSELAELALKKASDS